MADGVSSEASSARGAVRALRLAGGAIAAALGVSGVVLGGATVASQAWFAVAFEAMIAIAGSLGLIWSLRKPHSDAALAILFVAGSIFVASVLAWVGAGRMLGSFSLTPVLAGRLGACAALASAGGAIHVADRPAWACRRVALGLILVALPVGASAALWLAPALRTQLRSLHPALLTAGGALVFVIVVGALSAGAHLLITTFHSAGARQERPPVDSPSPG